MSLTPDRYCQFIRLRLENVFTFLCAAKRGGSELKPERLVPGAAEHLQHTFRMSLGIHVEMFVAMAARLQKMIRDRPSNLCLTPKLLW